MSPPVLEVEKLTISFLSTSGRVAVVKDLDLTVESGRVVALVGESGCGKTVTALSILRLLPANGRIDVGSIRVLGTEIVGLPRREMRQIRGKHVAMIFQEPMACLNPVLTAGQQVANAVALHENVGRKGARKRAIELLKRVDIPDPDDRFRSYPHQLSGGMQQRIMIAIAIASRPSLLIADEPTTALDVTVQAEIIMLLRDLQRDMAMSILLITHDLGLVNELADDVAVMRDGTVVEHGSRTDILSVPRHPYTQKLIRSAIRDPRGTPPSQAALPAG